MTHLDIVTFGEAWGCSSPKQRASSPRLIDLPGGWPAGLISALLEGETIEQAVTRGNRVGACAIQAIGDMDGLPTRAQLGLPTPAL